MFNHENPSCDDDLVSPHNIIHESHNKVKRIREMITTAQLLTVKQILPISILGK